MDDVLKATRTQRVSVEGTKRGQNPSSNLGLVNTFGGSAFKPAKPVRKDMEVDKGSAVMATLGHQKKQPGTKPIAGGEKAFAPQVKKDVQPPQPVTKADMEELAKSLKGLKEVMKNAVMVMGRGIPKKGKFDSVGRNYKKPEPKKKEEPTWA